MGRSLSNSQGALREDEIIMPTKSTPRAGQGSISYSGTAFRMEDQLGVFDPRSGVGTTINFGMASFNTLGEEYHEVRLQLGQQAQNIVIGAIVDVGNHADKRVSWQVYDYIIDATGVDVKITIMGDDFIHESEDFMLEFEYCWR